MKIFSKSNKTRVLILLVLIFILCVFFYAYYINNIFQIKEKSITIEAGSEISKNVSDYIKGSKKIISNANIDMGDVDVSTVGNYTLYVKYNNRSIPIQIIVNDTESPVLNMLNKKPYEVGVNESLLISDLEIEIKDVSPTVITFANGSTEIKYDMTGNKTENVKVVDSSNNLSECIVQVNVIDKNTPVIEGVKDLSTTVGNEIDMLSEVTASDIEDGDITANITYNQVDFNTIGTQEITYSVSDKFGNVSTQKANLVVKGNSQTQKASSNNPTNSQIDNSYVRIPTKENPAPNGTYVGYAYPDGYRVRNEYGRYWTDYTGVVITEMKLLNNTAYMNVKYNKEPQIIEDERYTENELYESVKKWAADQGLTVVSYINGSWVYRGFEVKLSDGYIYYNSTYYKADNLYWYTNNKSWKN